MANELQALAKTHTWNLVDLSLSKTVVGCKLVYKIKTRSNDSIKRYKSHLFAKGYTQEYGIDYEETFAQACPSHICWEFTYCCCRSQVGIVLIECPFPQSRSY